MEISKFPKQKSQCDSLISRGIWKKWEITVFPSYSKLATLPDFYLDDYQSYIFLNRIKAYISS